MLIIYYMDLISNYHYMICDFYLYGDIILNEGKNFSVFHFHFYCDDFHVSYWYVQQGIKLSILRIENISVSVIELIPRKQVLRLVVKIKNL